LTSFGLCLSSGMWKFYKRPQCFGDWICLRPQVDGAGLDLLSWARQKELVSITGQTPVRRKQLINTRQPVSSVGDRNKITIKDMHPHPQEDGDRPSLRNVVVFCKTSTYQMIDRVQKKSDSSVQHTPSSESFQVYL
jgi:hypothetical protein